MRAFIIRWLRRLAGMVVVLLVVGAGAVWWQRETLLVCYAVRGLANATDQTRSGWIERVARREPAAVPFLVSGLRRTDRQACTNICQCLLELAKNWPDTDSRRVSVAQALAREFHAFSVEGHKAALEVEQALSEREPALLAPALAAAVMQAAKTRDAEVHARALGLAERLTQQPPSPTALVGCRELVRVCLRDVESDNRVRALRLAIDPHVDLREQVVPLLRDPAPEIRRAAMIVLGPAADTIATDDLLEWMHDPDPEVRRLCESSLKGRGLHDDQLRLGRLLTDPSMAERLKVIDALQDSLRHNSDVEPGVWLRRLSHDPAPAVRAASVRMAADQSLVDLSDRLEQMCQDDPSPTIRQLARYYLSCRKRDRAQ